MSDIPPLPDSANERPPTENAPIGQEPVSAGAPEPAAEPTAEPAVEAQPKRGLMYHLFSPETRLGRFMRPLLRWLTLAVSLFALGLLTGYLLLYRPAVQSLEATRADLQAVQQQLSDSETQQASLQSKLESAQQDYKNSQAALAKANARVQILKALPYLNVAHSAILDNRITSARTALESAQAEINSLLPLIKDDTDLATQIDTRLKLAISELAQEPLSANADLSTLIDRLEKLEQELAG